MELNHIRSRIGKRSVHKEHAFSSKRSPIALLLDPAAQYQLLPSPSKCYSKISYGRVDSVITQMIKLGESMNTFAQGIREYVRSGSKFSETVKGKLSLGTIILQIGGAEKVFRHKFNIRETSYVKQCV